MSALLRQGLAELLGTKIKNAKRKLADLLANVKGELNKIKTNANHRLFSDLIAPVEKHLIHADTLLQKSEASYFVYLGAIRNLELLQDVTRDMGALPNHYAQGTRLQNQLKEAEGRHSECEADITSTSKIKSPQKNTDDWVGSGGCFLLACTLLIGYFFVGHKVGVYYAESIGRSTPPGTASSQEFYALFVWPLYPGLIALWNWAIDGNFDLMWAMLRISFEGFSPTLTLLSIYFFDAKMSNARYESKKTRYENSQEKLRKLGNEKTKLANEIAQAKNGLDSVEREISGYRRRISQKLAEIHWK